MLNTFNGIVPRAVAVLALGGLASCGGGSAGNAPAGNSGGGGAETANAAATATPPSQLFSDDFKGACSGAGVAQAAAYDPRGTNHKALYFVTYRDTFSDHSNTLPSGWTVPFASFGEPLKSVDLVVCARRTADQQVKVCDGFQSSGRATQNKVNWHTATYELTLHEARSGRQIAQSTVQANDTQCPMFETFEGENDTIDDYANPSDTAVADFLRPHMTH